MPLMDAIISQGTQQCPDIFSKRMNWKLGFLIWGAKVVMMINGI